MFLRLRDWLKVWKLVALILLFGLRTPGAALSNLPALIEARRPDFHPEGTVWDAARGRFLTGSVTEGTIFVVADTGAVTPFIQDDALVTTLGLYLDSRRNRLLVANADFFSEDLGRAQLAIYAHDSGKRLHLVELGALRPSRRNLANSVTVDTQGNAYVTDSFTPVIYKVTPGGVASIFVENPKLSSQTFGLNGIIYHPDGYLLAAVTEPGALFKIPLDNPDSLTAVKVSERIGVDGMILRQGKLQAVATTYSETGEPNSEVLELASNDNFESAEIINRVRTDPVHYPTTITLREGQPYVTHTHFEELFAGQRAAKFEIRRVDFSK